KVRIECEVGRHRLDQNDRAREPEFAMCANDRRSFFWRIGPMLNSQSSRANKEPRKLVGSISDDNDCPCFERIKSSRYIQQRFDTGTHNQGAVRTPKFVKVGGNVECGRGIAMNAS